MSSNPDVKNLAMLADAIRTSARSIARNWPEYLMGATEIGLFLIVACLGGAWVGHPATSLRQALVDPLARRVTIRVAKGLTAIGIGYSPLGERPGAHLNPV